MSNLNVLLGHTIKAVYVNADRTRIAFDTEVGPLVFFAEGGCCSNSWVEHIENTNLKGWVTAVEDIEMPEVEADNDYDHIQAYGVKINVGYRGTMHLEYRNCSNGHYGGWLEYEPGQSQDQFKLLTEDF